MSFNNNNKFNNNNGGRFHNHYIVPMSVGTTATPQPDYTGNSQQQARDAVAEAACHEQDRQMAAHINWAVLQPGFICHAASTNVASGNKSSSSAWARNGSKSSRSPTCYTSHIRRGTVTPLPMADKMRRYSSMFTPDRRSIIAQQTADFRSVEIILLRVKRQ